MLDEDAAEVDGSVTLDDCGAGEETVAAENGDDGTTESEDEAGSPSRELGTIELDPDTENPTEDKLNVDSDVG
jgi:hypothetical protein